MKDENEPLFYGVLVAPIPVIIYKPEFHYYQKGAVHIDCCPKN